MLVKPLQCQEEATRGDQQAVVKHLGEALAIGVPQGYLRRFLDEGEAARSILEDYARSAFTGARGMDTASRELRTFVDQLLDAFSKERNSGANIREGQPATLVEPVGTPQFQIEVEPLSEQGIKVLRLLCAGQCLQAR